MDQEDRKREVKADTMAMKYIFADVDGTLESAELEYRRKTDWRFGNMLKRAEASVYAQDVHRTV